MAERCPRCDRVMGEANDECLWGDGCAHHAVDWRARALAAEARATAMHRRVQAVEGVAADVPRLRASHERAIENERWIRRGQHIHAMRAWRVERDRVEAAEQTIAALRAVTEAAEAVTASTLCITANAGSTSTKSKKEGTS